MHCHFSVKKCFKELILLSLNLVIAKYVNLDFTFVRQKVIILKNYIRITFPGRGINLSGSCLLVSLNVCSALNHLQEQNTPRRLLITLLLQSKFSCFTLLGRQVHFRIA